MTSVLLYMPQSNMRPGFLDFGGPCSILQQLQDTIFGQPPCEFPPKRKLHKAVSENQNQTLPIPILIIYHYFPTFFLYFPHILKAPRSEPPLFFRCRRRSAQRGSRSRRASGPERPQASWGVSGMNFYGWEKWEKRDKLPHKTSYINYSIASWDWMGEMLPWDFFGGKNLPLDGEKISIMFMGKWVNVIFFGGKNIPWLKSPFWVN